MSDEIKKLRRGTLFFLFPFVFIVEIFASFLSQKIFAKAANFKAFTTKRFEISPSLVCE